MRRRGRCLEQEKYITFILDGKSGFASPLIVLELADSEDKFNRNTIFITHDEKNYGGEGARRDQEDDGEIHGGVDAHRNH